MDSDLAAINSGDAIKVGNEWHVNGRIYGEHSAGGSIFPIQGEGFTKLSRADYKAYVEIARVNGDVSKANSHDPQFTAERMARMAEVWRTANP